MASAIRPSTQVRKVPSGVSLQLNNLDRAGYERLVALRTQDPGTQVRSWDDLDFEAPTDGVLITRAYQHRRLAVVDPTGLESVGRSALDALSARTLSGYPGPSVGIVRDGPIQWMQLDDFLAGQPIIQAAEARATAQAEVPPPPSNDPRILWGLLDELAGVHVDGLGRKVAVRVHPDAQRVLWRFAGGTDAGFDEEQARVARVRGEGEDGFVLGRVWIRTTIDPMNSDWTDLDLADFVLITSVRGPALQGDYPMTTHYRPEMIGDSCDPGIYEVQRQADHTMAEASATARNLNSPRAPRPNS